MPTLYKPGDGLSTTFSAFEKFTDEQLIGAESALRLACMAPRKDAGQKHSAELHDEVLEVGEQRGMWRREEPK